MILDQPTNSGPDKNLSGKALSDKIQPEAVVPATTENSSSLGMRLMTGLRHKYTIAVSRLLVGGVFVLAGSTKLLEPIEDFISLAHSWNILPEPFVTWYIVPLPWVELIFGILLILGVFTRISAGVLALTLISFIIAISMNMARGRTLDECGCFGNVFHFGSTFSELLWRDAVLLGLSLIILQVKQPWLSVDRWLNFDRLKGH